MISARNLLPYAALVGLVALVFPSCSREVSVAPLLSNDPAIRNEALSDLKEWSPAQKEKGAPQLIEALNHVETDVVQRAVNALTHMGSDAVPFLIQALASESAFTRLTAVETLGRLKNKAEPAVTELKKHLSDPHPLVREEVVLALTHIGAPRDQIVQSLQLALKDPHPEVRELAQESLNQLHP